MKKRRKISIPFILEYLKDKPVILLSQDYPYQNPKTKLLVKCEPCGNVWVSSWDQLTIDKFCQSCAHKRNAKVRKLPIEKVDAFISSKNLKRRGPFESIKKPIEVECLTCGHQRKVIYEYLKTTAGCKKCSHKAMGERYQITLAEIKTRFKHRLFDVLDRNIKDGKSHITSKCQNCDYIWNTSMTNLGNSGCPGCCESRREKEVRAIFEDYFQAPFSKARPTYLRSPKTNRPLELDGFNEGLKLAFEYDGEFHYKNIVGIPHLKKQQERDGMKDVLCKSANISLIRIPYTEKHRLKEFIHKSLKALKYSPEAVND